MYPIIQNGHLMKVYGETINPSRPFISLNIGINDTAKQILYWTFEKYQAFESHKLENYCLVLCSVPTQHNDRATSAVKREIILQENDHPLRLRQQIHSKYNHQLTGILQVRHRRLINYPDSQSQLSMAKSMTYDMPYLVEVTHDTGQELKPQGLVIDLTDIFTRQYSLPIKLGTLESMVGPPPNVLIDKNLYPDVRPVHLTLSVVITTNSASLNGSKWLLPKVGDILQNSSHYNLLLTPSLDGFAKPPGPAFVKVNRVKVTGPILLANNSVLQLGKKLLLKYVQPSMGAMQQSQSTAELNINRQQHHQQPRESITKNTVNGSSKGSVEQHLNKNSNGSMTRSELQQQAMKTNPKSKGSTASDCILPLSIELTNRGYAADAFNNEALDAYIQVMDDIFHLIDKDLYSNTHRRQNQIAHFPLASAYTFYLIYRACIQQLKRSPSLSERTSTPSSVAAVNKDYWITNITNYMATKIYEAVPNFDSARHADNDVHLIKPLVYWLGNSSELLHFLKNDIDLFTLEASNQPQHHEHTKQLNKSSNLTPSTRDVLHLLAETVDHCFYYLRSLMNNILQPWLTCLTHSGDSDRNDNLELDNKPIDVKLDLHEPITMQIILRLFTYLMQQLRRFQVNAALTFQLYSQLFHYLSAHIFNTALIDTSEKAINSINNQSVNHNNWLTGVNATRLLNRIDRIKNWAERQGLELAAECRLQRCTQACQLILASRSNLDEFYQYCMNLISLNSLQLEWLLINLADMPKIPDDWIDLIVTGAKVVNDRAYAEEIEHYINTGSSEFSVNQLQLNELKELPIPLLLPADGYVSDSSLSGLPNGLIEFLQPLVKKEQIKIIENKIICTEIADRPWTNCMRLSKFDAESHPTTNPPTLKHKNIHDISDTDDDDTTSSTTTTTSSEIEQRPRHPKDGRSAGYYRANTASLHRPTSRASSLGPAKSNSYRAGSGSLPDLTMHEFQKLAKLAKVPADSIVQFNLKKLNNSLGLSIVAAKAQGHTQYGIYVKEIVPNGAAARDGRLECGDQLLAIGNSNLIGCAQSDAVAALSKMSGPCDSVQLIVAKYAADYNRILELIKPGGENKSNANSRLYSNHSNDDNARKTLPLLNKSQPDLHRNMDPITHQSKPAMNKFTNKPRANYRPQSSSANHQKSTQGAALSRSTPTLNLTQVGTNVDTLAHKPKRQPQTGHPHNSKRSLSARPVNGAPATFHSSDHNDTGDDETLSSPSSSINLDDSYGSDVIKQPINTRQPKANVNNNNNNNNNNNGDKSKDNNNNNKPRHYHSRQTHKNNNEMSSGHQYMENEYVNDAINQQQQQQQRLSNSSSIAFTTVESLSSEETVCHLDEYNNNDNNNNNSERPVYKERGHQQQQQKPARTKHQPPPLAPPTTNSEHVHSIANKTSREYAGNEYRSESRQSTHEHQSAVVTQYGDGEDKILQHDEINNTFHPTCPLQDQSNSMDQDYTWDQQPHNTVAKPSTQPVLDEQESMNLKPPAHAIVSRNRWTENETSPIEFSDLPVVHRDPRLGRGTNTWNASNITHCDPPNDLMPSEVAVNRTLPNDPPQAIQQQHSQPTLRYRSTCDYSDHMPLDRSQLKSQTTQPSNQQFEQTSNFKSQYPLWSVGKSPVPLPPPTPTAEYPQYHPPERLEPTDVNNYKQPNVGSTRPTWTNSTSNTTTNSITNNNKDNIGYSSATNVSGASNAFPSNKRWDNADSVNQKSNFPTATNNISASDKVKQLENEVQRLEIKQREQQSIDSGNQVSDLCTTLDRLRVELQFQRRLAERESNSRKYSTINSSTSSDKNRQFSQCKYSSHTVPVNSPNQEWLMKRAEAEKELQVNQDERVRKFELDHHDLLLKQEQRSRERAQWLKSQDPQSLDDEKKRWNYRSLSYTPLKDYHNHNIMNDSNNRYGYPKFDDKSFQQSLESNQPNWQLTSQNRCADVDSNRLSIDQSNDPNQRVKKSVSFDKNLETISIYNQQDNSGRYEERQTHATLSGDDELMLPQVALNSTDVIVPRSSDVNSGLINRKLSEASTTGQPILQERSPSAHYTTRSSVPNAESLSFKEKMRFFAEQIGEDLPKERIKASSRQRSIQLDNNIR